MLTPHILYNCYKFVIVILLLSNRKSQNKTNLSQNQARNPKPSKIHKGHLKTYLTLCLTQSFHSARELADGMLRLLLLFSFSKHWAKCYKFTT